MKIISLIKVVCLLSFTTFHSNQLNAQIQRPIGTNLSGIVDWSTEFVFVDVFKQCREWIPHENNPGAPWSSNVNIPLRPDGYPLEIPYDNGVDPPQTIRTLMYFGDLEGHYPEGNYRLIASGTGQIRLWGAANGTFSCPVDTFVSVASDFGGIALEIDISIATDPVRDIHFIMPGFENSYTSNPFNPALMEFVEDFQVIRFMDWMRTNNSPVSSWSDRNATTYFSQTLDNGIAYEHLIDFCNRTKIDPWVCIPHRADDEYVAAMANLMKDSLDPDLKIYVEYSNEVWNAQFGQSQYADSMGAVLNYPGNLWEQGWQFYAKRTADIFRIFETEFQGSDRLIKVISSQAANSWVTNYILERFEDPFYNPTQVQADAIAIAPYFGGAVANIIGDAGLMNSITVEDILDSMELSLPTSYEWMDDSKTVADEHNLELIAYEGGQHLVANGLYHNDIAYVNKLTDANRHPRMQDLYCDYFNYWFDNTQAGMFCHFSSHGIYSKWGSWGVKEFMEDISSPKYLGLQNCVFNYNIDSTTVLIDLYKNDFINIYPIPSNNGLITIEHNLENPNIQLFDITGKQLNFSIITENEKELNIKFHNYRGMAVLVLNDSDTIFTRKILVMND